jgi:hypothetical protein
MSTEREPKTSTTPYLKRTSPTAAVAVGEQRVRGESPKAGRR